MSRLTRCEPKEHSMFPYQLKDDEISTKLDSIHRLGKLEDLEDELCCPLDVVFKALKEQYVIFKHAKGIENPVIKFEKHKIEGLIFNGKDFDLWLYENYGDDFCVSVKDYKKTWFLKEDLSE